MMDWRYICTRRPKIIAYTDLILTLLQWTLLTSFIIWLNNSVNAEKHLGSSRTRLLDKLGFPVEYKLNIDYWMMPALALFSSQKWLQLSAAIALIKSTDRRDCLGRLFCDHDHNDPQRIPARIRYWRTVTLVFVLIDSAAMLMSRWPFLQALLVFKLVPLVFVIWVDQFTQESFMSGRGSKMIDMDSDNMSM